MREYETWEVIKMLGENPKLRFETIACNGNKLTAYNTPDYDLKRICWDTKGRENNSYGDKVKCPFDLTSIVLGYKWTLVRQPVPAWEAIKAYLDGGKVYYENPEGSRFYLASTFNVSVERFSNGVWFIEEGEA